MFNCRQYIWLFNFYITFIAAQEDIISNALDYGSRLIPLVKADFYMLEDKLRQQLQGEKVEIKIYYECLCPDCRRFDTQELVPVIQKLGPYLNIYTYPFGNAKMEERNGNITFTCQHGPTECYGNKLHACALDIVPNKTDALLMNSCMMESAHTGRGSDDAAADRCGKSMGINSEPIKQCAKGQKGIQLLKYYAEESAKVQYNAVPYILLNGKNYDGENFMRDVCAAFIVPPPPCK